MQRERGNGANIIIVNQKGEILVVRQNYGAKQWMLSGGEIERGESPRHAAQEETWEETGLTVNEEDMHFIALFVQRPNGFVCLYEATRFSGELISEPTEEILDRQFMSFQEIMNRGEEFGLAYRRMILHYKRCVHGLSCTPIEARLSDRVEYPKGLDLEFEGILLQI